MWFAVGDEQFVDASRAVARRAAQQGVQVDWIQFEAMPHCFAKLPGLDTGWQSITCMQKWATFCKACVEPKNRDHGDRPRVKAVRVDYSSGAESEISLDHDPTPVLPLDEVERRIHAVIEQDESDFQTAQAVKVTSKLSPDPAVDAHRNENSKDDFRLALLFNRTDAAWYAVDSLARLLLHAAAPYLYTDSHESFQMTK